MKRTNGLLRFLLGVIPVALFLTLGASSAQAQGRGGWSAGPQFGRAGCPMVGQMNLTESQQAQVNEIILNHRNERMQRRQAVRDQISEVLTPEQREQFQQLQNERPNYRRPGMRGMRGRANGSGAMFYGRTSADAQLDLTPDQQTQLNALRAEHFAAQQEWLRANPNATWADQLAWRQSMQADMLDKAAAFLSAEQLEQLKTLQASRPRGRF